MNQVVPMQKPSLIAVMANAYNMEPARFASTVKKTCMSIKTRDGFPDHTDEEFAAFLMVAQKHNLNPITREIYAFAKQGGGVQPIVSVDGWMKLINDHPQFDGMEFEDEFDKAGNLVAITCRMHRKDRSHPIAAKEYMEECKRSTEPWQKWPARMLRHKAAIQAARYAFSFSGIIDPEEAERSPEVITDKVIAPAPQGLEEPETVEAESETENAEELFTRAKQWGQNCNTGEDVETFLDEFGQHLDGLKEEDRTHLQSIIDEVVNRVEPNTLAAV